MFTDFGNMQEKIQQSIKAKTDDILNHLKTENSRLSEMELTVRKVDSI